MNKSNLSKLCILFASIVAVLSSCLKNDFDEPYTDSLEFSIRVPAEWLYESDINDTVRYYAISPLRDNDVQQGYDTIQEDLIVLKEYYPFATLEDFFLNELIYYESDYINYDSISTENFVANENDFIKHVYLQSILLPSRVDPEVEVEIELKMIRYFVMRDDYAYTISCSTQPNTFSTYSPVFETIINSFEFQE